MRLVAYLMSVCSTLIFLMQIKNYYPLHFFESYQLLQIMLLMIIFTYKKYYNSEENLLPEDSDWDDSSEYDSIVVDDDVVFGDIEDPHKH